MTEGETSGIIGSPWPFTGTDQEVSVSAFVHAAVRCFKLNPGRLHDDVTRIAFLGSRLKGRAGKWYYQLELRNDPALGSWPRFSEAITKEFTNTRSVWQTRVELATLRQGSMDVAEYAAKFKALAMQCEFGDQALLTCFYLGLASTVQAHLERQAKMPASFDEILVASVDFGSRQSIIPNRQRQHVASRFTDHTVNDMEVDVISAKTPPRTVPKGPISDEERLRRIKEGLCTYCAQPGHFRKNCRLLQNKQKN